MIYDYLVELVGTPPAGLEWLLYVLSAFVVLGLISLSFTVLSQLFRFPFKR